MGFGGGALIGAPLAVDLMKFYSTPTSTGVAPTMLTMGLIYLCFMLVGAFIVRIPAPDWKPASSVIAAKPKRLVTDQHVLVDRAVKTPQFYLLWRAVPQRHGGDRRARPGVADDPRDVPGPVPARHAGGDRCLGRGGRRLRRLAQHLQHGRPNLLGLDL